VSLTGETQGSILFRLLLLTGVCSFSIFALEDPWQMPGSLAEFEQQVAAEMQGATKARENLVGVTGPRTAKDTLEAYDDIEFHLGRVSLMGAKFRDLHPDTRWREAGAKAVKDVDTFRTGLIMDRSIYDALASLRDVPGDAQWYVKRKLADWKREGVLLPEHTRKQITEVREEIDSLQQQYRRNVAADRGEVRIPATQLDSLPPDFMNSHSVGPDGMIAIRNVIDCSVIRLYAQNADARRHSALFCLNRGYPENENVLVELMRARNQLAKLTGFPNYAAYAADSRMVGSVERQRGFLRSVERASLSTARREREEVLARKKKDFPQADRLNAEDTGYYQRLAREAKFQFDTRQVREYLSYTVVKEAILGVSASLFGLEFRPLKEVSTWHPSVEAYEVIDRGETIGRFYLDMHPRANKYQGCAAGPMRVGVASRQIPEVVMMCGLPDPSHSPALLDPDHARAYFHEFGHLLHFIFAGRQRWSGPSRPEADFMEAPSLLFEEWFENPEILIHFTRHYKTGEKMPLEMARTLVRAKDFGKAALTHYLLALSWYFLDAEDDAEPTRDPGTVYREHQQRLDQPVLNGTHPELGIDPTAVSSYAAALYTYLWSRALAKDIFTQFDPKDLLAPKVAREYRRKILEPGGTMPAAEMVRHFLGRPWNVKAFEAWLAR
jgi:thimet oligopeptidase